MKKVTLSTENTCDLPVTYLREKDISYLELLFYVNDEEFGGDTGKTKSFKEFYNAMRGGAVTRTSQINEDTFDRFFTGLLERGQDIVHLCFASALSGTFESALKAADKLNKINKNKIYVVDSLSQSGGQGLLVSLVWDKAEEGLAAKDLYDYAENLKTNIAHYFVVDDLKYLSRGGRISRTSAIIGNILKIKPVLHTNETGKLVPLQKVMSRKKSLSRLVEKMKERYNGHSKKVYITHGDCLEDAQFVAGLVESGFGLKPEIFELDFVIGSHSGPGTVALFFTTDTRIEKK